ncbi:MAG TPA: hypothetical protein VEZ47_05660 [Gemmatirosa sp.]|jgi:hypothetical protein|nr:hypothetical protein [Gemmatirosa sp.]
MIHIRPRARRMSGALLAAAACTAAVLAARPVAAQVATGAPPVAQLPYLQTLSVNPLAIPLGIFSVEYEVALPTPGFTAAVGGTYTSNNDIFERRDRWIEGRLMYYPNEVQLKGLSLGLSLGVRRAARKDSDAPTMRPSDSGPTFGVMAGYNYLVGRQQRLVLGGGIGAMRVLKSVGGNSPLSQVYPDGRLLVGLAF